MLVDTDIIIWYMRDNSAAIELLDSNRGFFISVVTYMELVQGMKNKEERQALKTGLALWRAKILHIDEAISTKAMLFVEQYFQSHSMQLADALVGTTALLQKLPLHTGNLKHFSAFKELELRPFSA